MPEVLPAVEVIDGFLTAHKERGMFSRRETVDILLDVRSAIMKENHALIQEEPVAPDRSDTDSRQPVHSESTSAEVGSP